MTDRKDVFTMLTEKDITRFWSKIDVRGPADCWPWLAKHKKRDGRGIINFHGIQFIASRAALALNDGFMPDEKTFACHSCDNPPCCNPSHLWWGTIQDNVADAVVKGRMHKWGGYRSGERNPNAKLNAEIVSKIRADKDPHRAIAAKYGVCKTTITNIKSFTDWRGQ